MSAIITTLPGAPESGIQFGNRKIYQWQITFDAGDTYPSAGISLRDEIAAKGYPRIGQMIITNAKGMNDGTGNWVPAGFTLIASHSFNWVAEDELLKINGNAPDGADNSKKIQAGAVLTELVLQVEAYTQPLSGE